MGLLTKLFENFTPQGHCYLWTGDVLWLHVISDAVIFVAYYSIPVALIYFIRKRRDLPFHGLFWLFGAFILLCGTTHLMQIWTTWYGTYRLEGLIKALTAAVSITTAFMLWKIMPAALQIPSSDEMQDLNKNVVEMSKREQKRLQELSQANKELRRFNKNMIDREERVVELKQEINALCRELGKPELYNSTNLLSYEIFDEEE